MVLVGLPGSGKSTWARRQGVAVLSSDEIRFTLADSETDQTIHAEVFATIRYLLRRRLDLQRPLTFVDATNITRRERRPYIHLGRLYDCDVDAVFFDVQLATCLSRNATRARIVPDRVIESMFARMEPPTVQEGFTSITCLSV